MWLYVLISGILFGTAGMFWQFLLVRYEINHPDSRGMPKFTGYNGYQRHENNKTYAGLLKATGVLLLIVAGFLYVI